jgi:hypothetical protein
MCWPRLPLLITGQPYSGSIAACAMNPETGRLTLRQADQARTDFAIIED